ncbi:MAG: sporulation protein [Erysipelotrichaceae bacterium]|nr:sporulation protein [Erysipelotrichaceae bacterium]MCI9524855.1 sporulation protein [Erysipelotrichaceae bacterium]
MRYSELSQKQVIDMKSGKVIGKVNDLFFLEKDYAIKEFYVSMPPSCLQRLFPWFFPNDEIAIRICDIVSIGEDIVLVQI